MYTWREVRGVSTCAPGKARGFYIYRCEKFAISACIYICIYMEKYLWSIKYTNIYACTYSNTYVCTRMCRSLALKPAVPLNFVACVLHVCECMCAACVHACASLRVKLDECVDVCACVHVRPLINAWMRVHALMRKSI